eukprot:12620553-Heterocapsa_arctica.AAC.1
MPIDTPAVTPDPHTSETEDEKSPTSAPVTLAPVTPTHPPTETMEAKDEDADVEKEPVDDVDVAPADPPPL